MVKRFDLHGGAGEPYGDAGHQDDAGGAEAHGLGDRPERQRRGGLRRVRPRHVPLSVLAQGRKVGVSSSGCFEDTYGRSGQDFRHVF